MTAYRIFRFVDVNKGKVVFVNHTALGKRLKRAGRQHCQVHLFLLQRTKNVGGIRAVEAHVVKDDIDVEPMLLKLAQSDEPAAETRRIVSCYAPIANVAQTSDFLTLSSLDKENTVGV